MCVCVCVCTRAAAKNTEGLLLGLPRVVYRTVYRQVVKTDYRLRLRCCQGFYESSGICIRESCLGPGLAWSRRGLAHLLKLSLPPPCWGYSCAPSGACLGHQPGQEQQGQAQMDWKWRLGCLALGATHLSATWARDTAGHLAVHTARKLGSSGS